MGLDNGICIKNRRRESLSLWPFKYPFESDFDEDVEICYWRKYWTLRNSILLDIGVLESEGGDYPLSIRQVKRISRIISGYLKDPESWEERFSWAFDESKLILREDLWNLWWLRWWMLFHPKEIVYFYDSF